MRLLVSNRRFVGLAIAALVVVGVSLSSTCYTHEILVVNLKDGPATVEIQQGRQPIWRARIGSGEAFVRIDATAAYQQLEVVVAPGTPVERRNSIGYLVSPLRIHSLYGSQTWVVVVTRDALDASRMGPNPGLHDMNPVEFVAFHVPRRLLQIATESVSCADDRLAMLGRWAWSRSP